MQSYEPFVWSKGMPVKEQLPEKVVEFLDQVVFPHYYKIFEDERHKEVIEKTLECIRELLEVFGPSSVQHQMDRINAVIIMLLEKKAFCQTKQKNYNQGEEAENNNEEGEFEDEEEGDD